MKNRSVVAVIIFSLITCGLYSIYWHYVVAQELNAKEPNDPLMNYIGAIILSIITCGIFMIYWNFKFYKKVDSVFGEDNFIVNFLLSLFGFSIVSQAIVQNSINLKA